MKLLQSAFLLCALCCSIAQAQEAKDKCGCSKPKPVPTSPSQVMKPAGQKNAAAPAHPEQKGCPAKPCGA